MSSSGYMRLVRCPQAAARQSYPAEASQKRFSTPELTQSEDPLTLTNGLDCSYERLTPQSSHKERRPMNRFLTFAILFHWMMFFALHAFMALAGTSAFGFLHTASSLEALPMIEAGMGIVSILAAVLFSWALLSALSRRESGGSADLDLERAAFASAAFIFSCLSMMAILQADSAALVSASAYFAAILVSWAAASVEWELLSVRTLKLSESEASRHARTKAGDAGWHIALARISGRKENP
jgi:hypothetical protein